MTQFALFPFRYFDVRMRKWYRARYVARLSTIAETYAAFQLTGSPEIRQVGDLYDDAPGRRSTTHI